MGFRISSVGKTRREEISQDSRAKCAETTHVRDTEIIHSILGHVVEVGGDRRYGRVGYPLANKNSQSLNPVSLRDIEATYLTVQLVIRLAKTHINTPYHLRL